MARGVDYGKLKVGRLELPEGNINGNAAFAFGLEIVEDPGILERTLAKFSSFFFVLFNSSLVNASKLEDEMLKRASEKPIQLLLHLG